MTAITGAQGVVRSLERAGIEVVFGVPGAHNSPIFDALYHHPRIKCIVTRHEQGAAFMADAYARASGKIAAVLMLPGPGVTNAYTGLGEAYTDSSPVLLLATQIDRAFINQNRGLLHELTNQYEVLAPIMKHSERITDASEIPDALHRAVQALRSGRPRPVQVEIPRDVQMDIIEWPDAESAPPPPPRPRPCAPAEAIRSAALALRDAARPLIFAGGGVVSSDGGDILRQLAERLGAPVLTTGMGVGCIPTDHPLATGVAWVASADIRPLIAASDALLAVGTRFNEGMTHGWQLDLPPVTVRIDIDADEIERNLPMQMKLVGDARATLQAIDAHLKAWNVERNAPAPEMAQARRAYRRALEERVGTTRPWMNALRASIPRDTIISADMSLFWADMLGIFPTYQPRTVLFPWGYGTLGFGIPGAIGAKIAQPKRPVISITGDGAFLYTGMELATAVKYKLNIPFLVPNNNAYGMIKMQQAEQFDERFIAVDLSNPDFVELARAFGAYGTHVTNPEGLGKAVTEALAADKPTVIEFPWGCDFGHK